MIISVEKDDIHKIMKFCGLKFKFKSKELILQKERNLRNNYESIRERLKSKIKSEKIRVAFISNEIEKWSYDFLFKEFQKDSRFEPFIVVYPLLRLKDEEIQKSLDKQYNFYNSRNYKVEYGYKNCENVSIKEFNPDIVFYPQQYDIIKDNMPFNVSEYALTMYVPYGISSFDLKNNYNQKFHRMLYKMFCEHDLMVKSYESFHKGNSRNCLSLGYPKLDEYINKENIDLNKYWKEPEKIRIIYAPHHSLSKDCMVRMGTFMKNYKFILELAQKYSDITTWVFKPHPRLYYDLKINNRLPEEEIENYWQAWNKIGKINESGDYLKMFQSSNLMITDCASFLTEYIPSKNPIIRLVRKDAIKLNKFGQRVVSQYYPVYDNNELEKVFKDLVINKNDYKKEKRLQIISEIIDLKEPSSKKIYKYILSLLGE